jgi:hypothetical protein
MGVDGIDVFPAIGGSLHGIAQFIDPGFFAEPNAAMIRRPTDQMGSPPAQ